MRISKQVCFLVAAAIASAVDGAPIGEKLQRRQEIMLELTPTQKVDVDGSREVPTILITDNGGLRFAPPGCSGGECGPYSIDMPPLRQYQDHMVPPTTYDPYSENYAYSPPMPTYPPSRAMAAPLTPVQAQPPLPMPSAQVQASPSNGAVNAPNAGWFAPLIPTGNFQPALNAAVGTATSPSPVPASLAATTTTTAPSPIPGAIPSNPLATTGQATAPPSPPPAAPLPGAVTMPAPPVPASVPTPDPKPATTLPVDPKDSDKKPEGEAPKPETVPPPPPATPATPSAADIQKITDQAKAQEAAASKDAPKQRRNLRSVGSRNTSGEKMAKRNSESLRLRKRQLSEPEPISGSDCSATTTETKETLIPVTELELAQLQEGTAELISYPTIEANGVEGQMVYDVIPIQEKPEPLHPKLKSVLDSAAAEMSSGDENQRLDGANLNTSEVDPAYRSNYFDGKQESSQENKRALAEKEMVRDLNARYNDLHKRLKHDSNGLNASLVKNGIGKTKYGYSIHDNNGASSSMTSIGLFGTMAIAAAIGIWTAVL